VKRDVIPPLNKSQQGILALLASGSAPKGSVKKLAKFAANIASRIQNLQNNYLEGKGSDFAPEERSPNTMAEPPP